MPSKWMIFRPLNLGLLALCQFLVYIFIGKGDNFLLIAILSFGTICIAASGNMINDYYDRVRDEVNKPGVNFAQWYLDRKLFWPVYAGLNLIGIGIASLINTYLGALFIGTAMMLWLYSAQWKDLPLLGNLSISFLAAISLLIVRLIQPSMNVHLLMYYAFFAFITTWIREAIKDMEDKAGDELSGSKSLAVKASTKINLLLIRLLILVLMVILYDSWSTFRFNFDSKLEWIVLIYGITTLILPNFAILIKCNQENPDYALMSKLVKYCMLTGMLSMMFL